MTKVGTYLNPPDYGAGTTTAQAITNFQTVFGRTMGIRRVYFGPSSFPGAITNDLKADANAGRKVALSFKPAYNPTSSADRTALNTFLLSCHNFGLVADVALWHEYYAEGLTAAQYKAMIAFYGPTVRNYYRLTYQQNMYPLISGKTTVDAGFTVGAFDLLTIDFYCTDYNINSTALSIPAALADTNSLPFGIWEFNGKTPDQSQATVTSYFNYIKNFFVTRASAGKPNADILLFNHDDGTPNAAFINSGADFRVPLYQSLTDALTSVNLIGVTAPVVVSTDSFAGISMPGAVSAIAVAGRAGTLLATSGAIVSGATARVSVAAQSGTLPPPLMRDSNVKEIDWGIGNPVSVLEPISYDVTAQRIFSSKAITWQDTSHVVASCPVTWEDLKHAVTKKKITWQDTIRKISFKKIRFNADSKVVSQKAVSFKVKKKIASSSAEAFNLNKRISAKKAIRWNSLLIRKVSKRILFNDQATHVVASIAVAFMDEKRLISSKASSWILIGRKNNKKKILWNLKKSVVSQKAVTFMDRKKVTASSAITWNLNKKLTAKKKMTWESTTRKKSQKAVFWILRKQGAPQKTIAWRVPVNRISASSASTWEVLQHV